MRWLLVAFTAFVGCALYETEEECEPFIKYNAGYGPPGEGCHNLEFYEIEVPDFWYPTDTRAQVNECKPQGHGERLFECEPDGHWRELFVLRSPEEGARPIAR